MQIQQLMKKLDVDLESDNKDISMQTKNKLKIDDLRKKYQTVQTELYEMKNDQKDMKQKVQKVDESQN